jgi:hypothetical protein
MRVKPCAYSVEFARVEALAVINQASLVPFVELLFLDEFKTF